MSPRNLWQRIRALWTGDDPAFDIGPPAPTPADQLAGVARRLEARQAAARDAMGARHLLHPTNAVKRTGAGRTGDGRTGAGRTGAGRTGAGRTGAGRTGGGRTGAGRTGGGRTANKPNRGK